MVHIKAQLPTKNLPIRRVMAKLFQSFVYRQLDDKEHEGYKHPNGKVFKAMNFKIQYIENEILIKYAALDKENEKKIATAILKDGLKLGEIHIASVEVSLQNRSASLGSEIEAGGFVAAAIKDGNSSKKIYLEPQTHKFAEIITNNILQKYEALYSKPYEGALSIEVTHQKRDMRTFFYNKGVMRAWHAGYKIIADKEMLELILDTGLGAHAMQGLGFVEVRNISD